MTAGGPRLVTEGRPGSATAGGPGSAAAGGPGFAAEREALILQTHRGQPAECSGLRLSFQTALR